MRESGLEPYSIMTARSSSYSAGGELLRQAQRDYPQIDSIFCTNDDLAIGAAFECQRQGLSIPQDMAIAGFHGHDIGQVMVPAGQRADAARTHGADRCRAPAGPAARRNGVPAHGGRRFHRDPRRQYLSHFNVLF